MLRSYTIDIRRILSVKHTLKYFALALGLALTLPAALAGQTITITDSDDYYGIICGNGDTSGKAPCSNSVDSVVGNTVLVKGTVREVYGAQHEGNAVVKNNTVTISGGTVSYAVGGNANVGGDGHDGSVEDNWVTISGGYVYGTVFGGLIGEMGRVIDGIGEGAWGISDVAGKVVNNHVTITDSNVDYSVYGGRAHTDEARGNSVTIGGSSVIGGEVLGGWSDGSDAFGNTVTVSGGTLNDGLEAGYSANGDATKNKIIISGGVIWPDSSNASVYAGTVGGRGSDARGNAVGNSIIITAGDIDGLIIGGRARQDEARDNSVTIDGGTFGSNVRIRGGRSDNGHALNNTVTISAGTFKDVGGGLVHGAGRAEGNSVTLSGGIFTDEIFGGGVQNSIDLSSDAKGDANDNTLTITGGTFNSSKIYGGYSVGGSTSGNTVILKGGTFESVEIYGGWAENDTADHEASGNTIIIEGKIKLIGGLLTVGYVNSGPNDKAVNNTFVIRGSPDMQNTDIRLGDTTSGGTSDTFSGNKLIYEADGPVKVKSIANVEAFEFTLPTNVGKDFVPLEAESIVFGDGKGKKSRIIGVKISRGSSLPDKLFALTNGEMPDLSDLEPSFTVQNGAFGSFDVHIGDDGTFSIGNKRANPETKAFSEGFAATAALGTQAADTAGEAIGAAATAVAQSGGVGQSFGVIGGGKTRHKTGSHVDVSGISLSVGVATGLGNETTVGAFVEYGNGDYDTYNSFSSGRVVRGSGDSEYLGLGLLGRYEFAGASANTPYLEGTVRFGRAKSDFKSSDLGASYDTKSNYHGLSLGGGYIWKISDGARFDLYGRYVWTHQAGDSVSIKTGEGNEAIKFLAADSHRVRFGGRYTQDWSKISQFYVGAAWEHEFDGKTEAKIPDGGAVDAPEMKGNTGMAEFGLVFSPTGNRNLSIDVGLQGYGGKRRGVTGSAQLKYVF
jgi:hypothetical protein